MKRVKRASSGLSVRIEALALLSALTAFLGILAVGHAAIGEEPSVLAERIEAAAFELTDEGYVADSLHFEVEERGGLIYRVFGQGLLDEAGTESLGDLLGMATGYGEGIADPVREFFDANASELVGEGQINLGVEQFLLSVEVSGAPPYAVDFSVTLQQIPEEQFPASDHAVGPEDASVVIREFSDFQCPFCARYAQEVAPFVKDELVARKDVRFEYHHLPLMTIHANAARAAEASECAAAEGGVGAFWEYHDALFAEMENWRNLDDPTEHFVMMAEDLTLDGESVRACLEEDKFAAAVEEAYAVATQVLGLRSTPTVFVGGFRLQNPFDLDEYEHKIRLAQAFSESE